MGTFTKIRDLYLDGLKSMKLGKTLWKIIGIKLVVIFVVFKLFFFPDVMDKVFETDSQKAEHVFHVLTANAGGNVTKGEINHQNTYLRR